jgi:ComEC/Rec2-related protein
VPDPPSPQPSPWPRVRLPCLGLFLALAAGVSATQGRPILWPLWAGAFIAASILTAWRGRTGPLLVAVFCFSAFWAGVRTEDDEGYRFARYLGVGRDVHLIRCRIQTEPALAQWHGHPEQRFTGRVIVLDGMATGFNALFSLRGSDLHQGDSLELSGRFSRPERPRNPGEMDWCEYYAHRHLFLRFSPEGQTTLITAGPRWSFQRLARQLRQTLEARLTAGIEDDAETCQLMRGIMFGDRAGMAPELVDLLERTGTLHLFVVDGLKVTFIAGLCWTLTRVMRAGRRLAALAVCLLLSGYGLLTGFTVSGVRAGGMCFLLIIGVSLERPGTVLNALGAIGSLLILADPPCVFATGFQLSFVVVTAVLVAVRPLSHWLERPFALDPFIPPLLVSAWRRLLQQVTGHVCDLVAVSAVCWLASLPILVCQFHRVSLSGLALNVVAVPIGSLMLATGAASICIGLGWATLGSYLNNCNWLLAKTFLAIMRSSTLLPCDAVNVTLVPRPEFECTLLATGREPVFHVHAGGRDWLLNVGSPTRWRSTVVPYLRFCGVNSLAGVFLAEPPDEELGQATSLHEEFHNRMVLCLPAEPPSGTKESPSAEPADASGALPQGLQFSLEAHAGNVTRPGKKPRVSWVILNLATFRLGWATSMARGALRDLPAALDVLVLPRADGTAGAQAAIAANARLVISLEGRGMAANPPGVPVLFLSRTGAVSFRPVGSQLLIRAYTGDQFTLSSRNR